MSPCKDIPHNGDFHLVRRTSPLWSRMMQGAVMGRFIHSDGAKWRSLVHSELGLDASSCTWSGTYSLLIQRRVRGEKNPSDQPKRDRKQRTRRATPRLWVPRQGDITNRYVWSCPICGDLLHSNHSWMQSISIVLIEAYDYISIYL